MSYKAIVTLIDSTTASSNWTEYAADLANKNNARLIGVAPRELIDTLSLEEIVPANSSWLADLQKRIDAEAALAVDSFNAYCKGKKLNSYEGRVITGTPEDAMKQESRYCDLIVLGQRMDSGNSISKNTGVIESLLLSTATPILIVPETGRHAAATDTVLVAWRNSRESSLCLRQSIPFLQGAKNVEIATVEKKYSNKGIDTIVQNELLAYLELHGVSADFKSITSDKEAAKALISYAYDLGADLLVMGGYGHARLQEWALGGVTKTMLQTMTLPVLMAH